MPFSGRPSGSAIGSALPPTKSTSPPAAAALSIEDLKDLIRDTVREELDQRDAKPARKKRS